MDKMEYVLKKKEAGGRNDRRRVVERRAARGYNRFGHYGRPAQCQAMTVFTTKTFGSFLWFTVSVSHDQSHLSPSFQSQSDRFAHQHRSSQHNSFTPQGLLLLVCNSKTDFCHPLTPSQAPRQHQDSLPDHHNTTFANTKAPLTSHSTVTGHSASTSFPKHHADDTSRH